MAETESLRTVRWDESGLKITCLRLLERNRISYDVQYCHGVLRDGTLVNVEVPFDKLPKTDIFELLTEAADREGFNARLTGIFTAISTPNWDR